MTEPHDVGTTKQSTRARILECAIVRFSTQSYELTGLREIANDAGVDVAWVHRSFGSKEKLFAECMRTCILNDRLVADDSADPIEHMFMQVLRPRPPGELRPIDIFVRSLSSSEAAGVIRQLGSEMIMPPLVDASSHGSRLRIALFMSFLLGFAVMRDVVEVEELVQADGEEIRKLMASAVVGLNGPIDA